MLALKLLLVPAFLALVSLAGRRWGPGIAGWLAGLPVVGGPILYFLTLERGPEFGAAAAVASLSGVFASLSFNLAYSWTALRANWPVALAAGVCAWTLVALALAQLPSSTWLALAVALAGLVALPGLFPRPEEPPAPRPLPKAELLARMAAGAALTLAVTLAASNIGPTWCGLLTVFPMLAIVLAVFSHASNGPSFAATLLLAMARGLCSFAAFCFSLALLLPAHGMLVSFALSVAVALAVPLAMNPAAVFAFRRSSG